MELITLHTKHTTYQMGIAEHGFLLHLYYGPKAEGDMSYLLTAYDRGFSGNPYDADRVMTEHFRWTHFHWNIHVMVMGIIEALHLM